MRSFIVVPGEPHTWTGIPEAAKTVTDFLAKVRVTGDGAEAERLLAAAVPAHQHLAERDETIVRSPAEYAAHVQDMLSRHNPITFEVQELLVEADHVFVRWAQHGRVGPAAQKAVDAHRYHREAGSAVYRVAEGRIQEYWIQLDRHGDEAQLRTGPARTEPVPGPPIGKRLHQRLPLTSVVRAGDWVVVSGQIGTRDGTLVAGGAGPQTEAALSAVADLLGEHDLALTDVAKTTVFMTSMDDYDEMNLAYGHAFSDTHPARTAVAVAALPLPEAVVEIEAWAHATHHPGRPHQ
ncbi:Rid family hydrolase [Oryzobacter telluris]|uniref:Rid family hydrolase n=1 Tax=Oryzobacter telluris TaxID=3149179 RepID=UPI00370D5D51